MLSPNDHARMLVEMLQAGNVELGRRWMAALFLAPEAERAAIVAAIERRMQATYGMSPAPTDAALDIAEPPRQRDGYVEQVVRTYGRASDGEQGEAGC